MISGEIPSEHNTLKFAIVAIQNTLHRGGSPAKRKNQFSAEGNPCPAGPARQVLTKAKGC
jgi:hypothetical protein